MKSKLSIILIVLIAAGHYKEDLNSQILERILSYLTFASTISEKNLKRSMQNYPQLRNVYFFSKLIQNSYFNQSSVNSDQLQF